VNLVKFTGIMRCYNMLLHYLFLGYDPQFLSFIFPSHVLLSYTSTVLMSVSLYLLIT